MIAVDSNHETGTQPAATACQSRFWTARRLALLLWVVVSLVLDVFFFTGFFGSDDISYLGYAINLLRDGGYEVNASNGRLTIVGWNTLILLLFGWNGQLVALTYVLFHQLLNLSTYALARRLFGDRVAMLALFGSATMPLLIVFSTFIVPDIPMACCFVLALHAFLRGLDARSSGGPRRARWWLLLAGVAVGFGYMAKETSLILLPFFLVMWLSQEWRGLFRRETIIRGAMFAVGFFGVMAIETAVLSAINDGFHFRMAWSVEELNPEDRTHIAKHGKDPIGRLDSVHGYLNDYFMFQPLKPVVIACFALYPFLFRKRWAVYLIGLWTFTYLTWGTMRFNEYFPPSIQARYFIPVVPFALIVTAAVLVRVYEVLLGLAARIRAVKPLQFAVIVLLGAYAALGLRGPNDIAGKMYGADDVTNTAMAIRAARDSDDRPTVLGPAVSDRAYRLFQRGQMPNVHMWLAAAPPGGLPPLLRQGGWHFILVDPDAAHLPSSYDPLSWPMAWIVRQYAADEASDATFSEIRRIWTLDPLIEDFVEYQGYRLCVQRVQRIRQPFTRTDRFAAEHLSMLNNWRTGADPYPGAHGVLLLDVVAQKLPEKDIELSLSSLKNWFGPRAACRNLTAAMGRGRGTRLADSLNNRRNDTGGPNITFKVPKRDFALFETAMGLDAAAFRIPANAQCDFNILFELTALSSSAHVDLEMEFYADPGCESRIDVRRTALSEGLNLLGVRTGDRPTYFRPVLRIMGRGRCEIDNFSMLVR